LWRSLTPVFMKVPFVNSDYDADRKEIIVIVQLGKPFEEE